MEDKTIEKVDFSIEELETNYYECTFDKCNFSDRGRKVNCVMRCFSFKLIGRGSASAKGVHQHSRRA